MMTSDWPRVLIEFCLNFLHRRLQKLSFEFLNDDISDIFTDQWIVQPRYSWAMNWEGQLFLNFVLGDVSNIHDIHVYTRMNTFLLFWPESLFLRSSRSSFSVRETLAMMADTVFTRIIVFPSSYQDSADEKYRSMRYWDSMDVLLLESWSVPLVELLFFVFVKVIISDLNNFDLILNSKIYRNRTDIRTSIWCLYLFRFW